MQVLLVKTRMASPLPTCSAASGAAECAGQALQGLLRCAAAETPAAVTVWGGPQVALAASSADAAPLGSQYGAAGDAGVLLAPLLLPGTRHVQPVSSGTLPRCY